jgi:hypothetical protein
VTEPAQPASRFERASPPTLFPELVPVFMMVETDLFRKLNEKAARRNIGYDSMLRIILREHLPAYE